jgi:hypothetical protein
MLGEVKYCWLQDANFLKLLLLFFFRDSAFVTSFEVILTLIKIF